MTDAEAQTSTTGPSSLAGHGALVTGGAGGLGSAIAARLAADGAHVTIMGRTESTLAEVVDRIAAAHPDAPPVHAQVGDAKTEDAVAEAAAQAASRAPLKIAVSVVGGGSMAPLLLFDQESFLADIENNTVPPFILIRQAIPAMTEAGGGSIVCISSDAATIPFKFMAPYCAGKAAVDALVRVAALEHAHLGIRINAIRPGLIQTDSVNSKALFADEEIIAEFVEEKPLGRTGLPTDVAGTVRFLAGAEASWVTGQSWSVEGGNELTKAPSLEKLVRRRWDGADVDAALAGRIPSTR